jgi:hypothetical protein
MFVFICKTDKSKPVKQEVNGTVILPPLVFPGQTMKTVFYDTDTCSSISESLGAVEAGPDFLYGFCARFASRAIRRTIAFSRFSRLSSSVITQLVPMF